MQWGNTITELKGKQVALDESMRGAFLNSFDAGFATFNRGIVSMLTQGKSFAQPWAQATRGLPTELLRATLRQPLAIRLHRSACGIHQSGSRAHQSRSCTDLRQVQLA
jgi:hypothetical protein